MYRIELQQPYGTLVGSWVYRSAGTAYARLRWAIGQCSKKPGFVAVFKNGREIDYATLRFDSGSTR